tara:strand:- start:1226 stop:2125 length:900 start_codon:yes stop_codon:yes gene_type:complete
MQTSETTQSLIKHNIEDYFNKQTFYERHNIDVIFTIIAILFVLFVVLYVYFSSRIDIEKLNWKQNKCNPFYMPFGRKINDGDEDFNKNNFSNCLNDLVSNIANDALSPITEITNLFSGMLKLVTSIMVQISTNLMHLFNILMSLFRELILRIQRILHENILIFSTINNFISQVLGFIAVLYYKLIIMVDSIKLMLPIKALAFLTAAVIPALLAFLLSLAIFCYTFYIGLAGMIPWCITCWAFVKAAVWAIITLILFVFFLFLLTLYALFADMAHDILQKTLKPISNMDDPIEIQDPPVP